MILGGLLSAAGLVLSSFASSLESLYIFLGILTGKSTDGEQRKICDVRCVLVHFHVYCFIVYLKLSSPNTHFKNQFHGSGSVLDYLGSTLNLGSSFAYIHKNNYKKSSV